MIRNEVEKLLRHEVDKYVKAHDAKVYIENGHTYIRFDVVDILTEESTKLIHNLLNLMKVPYCIQCVTTDQLGKNYIATVIPGTDNSRLSFIKEFIENDYTLSW